jgi:DNA helicase HerA-like ATPase
MLGDQASLIGHILDVQGSVFIADLSQHEDAITPVVTIGDEDISVGRLGSYVCVKQAELCIVAMVSRMTEREKLPTIPPTTEDAGEISEATALRTLQLVPIGTLNIDGEFERGVSTYPTTGAEVHALASPEIEAMFRRFKDKGYDVGVLSSNSHMRVHLDPSPLFGRHCAILGQTGAGKSWTVALLLQKAVSSMPHAHIIILDLHGEYRQAFTEVHVRFINAVELEIPYWLMTYAELTDLVIDRSEFSAHNQTAFFRDTLNTLRQASGAALGLTRTTIDTPVYFSLDKLRSVIQTENERMVPGATKPIKGPMHGDFDRFLMRLDSRMNDNRYDFLLKPKYKNTSESMEGLLRDFVGLGSQKKAITVIDLSSVPFDVRPTVTAQIGRVIFEFNYWNPRYSEFPILLVCEEAHAYIRRESDTQYEGTRKSMERIAKEGRKYGVGITVVSQRPHELSETVLSQCGTFVCLRMTNPDDQDYVRKLVPEAERDLVNILAGLRRGEALILGEAVPLPSRVQIDMPSPTPRSDDVDFYKQWREGPEDIDVKTVVDNWRNQSRDFSSQQESKGEIADGKD